MLCGMPWLPTEFEAPARLELSTGHHLRQISAGDVDIDYPAVMGSRERLWAKFGELWGWPPADMSLEDDRRDLERHVAEMEANESFNYAVFPPDEAELLGCVYVDPPPDGYDAESGWWVVDAHAGGPLEGAVDAEIPCWLQAAWGFGNVHRIG
jgi:hypothetical protein